MLKLQQLSERGFQVGEVLQSEGRVLADLGGHPLILDGEMRDQEGEGENGLLRRLAIAQVVVLQIGEQAGVVGFAGGDGILGSVLGSGFAPKIQGKGLVNDADIKTLEKAEIKIEIGGDIPVWIKRADCLKSGAAEKKSDGWERILVTDTIERDVLKGHVGRPGNFGQRTIGILAFKDAERLADRALVGAVRACGVEQACGFGKKVGIPRIVVVVNSDEGRNRLSDRGVGGGLHPGVRQVQDAEAPGVIGFKRLEDIGEGVGIAAIVGEDMEPIGVGLLQNGANGPLDQKRAGGGSAGDDSDRSHWKSALTLRGRAGWQGQSGGLEAVQGTIPMCSVTAKLRIQCELRGGQSEGIRSVPTRAQLRLGRAVEWIAGMDRIGHTGLGSGVDAMVVAGEFSVEQGDRRVAQSAQIKLPIAEHRQGGVKGPDGLEQSAAENKADGREQILAQTAGKIDLTQLRIEWLGAEHTHLAVYDRFEDLGRTADCATKPGIGGSLQKAGQGVQKGGIP